LRNVDKKTVLLKVVFAVIASITLVSCSSILRDPAVPVEDRHAATVLGIPNARFYSDQIDEIEKEQASALIREARFLGIKKGGVLPRASGLTLSGGADDGAFGAGLLVGWTAHGDRPNFKFVTGVSTGALMAPFAFLGSKYDATLKEVYTTLDASKVYQERFLPVAAVAQDALSDTDPLYRTISYYLDEKLLAEIAAEYKKGRLLAIQTTNLDAGRPVLWKIGAIAASGNPGALELVRKILLASASIPAAFPPVLFDVEANGKHYQEMHVDGGAVSQSFLAPAKLDIRAALHDAGYQRPYANLYVIRNGRLHTEWSDTDKLTFTIAQRSVSVLTNYSGVHDLYKMYMISRRANASFHLAYIPDEYIIEHKYDFDPVYMSRLFNYAYDKAAHGYPWDLGPPGFDGRK
jgi:predicted patatin/cPLA2 family phospholipase